MATFVLIPGAGADPRVYGATIEALREPGHDAFAPPLPLDDQQATPSDHADAVAEAVPSAGKLIVVAQSLGAFAESASAGRPAPACSASLGPSTAGPTCPRASSYPATTGCSRSPSSAPSRAERLVELAGE